MGVRDSLAWKYSFGLGITIGFMGVALWSYSGHQKKTAQRAEFKRRTDTVRDLDAMLRKTADKNSDGLDVREIRSIAKAAGYQGPLTSIDSVMIYDPEIRRDFDGGMLYPRSDMYLQGRTLHIPVGQARLACEELRAQRR